MNKAFTSRESITRAARAARANLNPLTARQISRAIVREWRFARDAGNNTPDGGIGILPSIWDEKWAFDACCPDWDQLAEHIEKTRPTMWSWFDTPEEARLYVLRHLGIDLPL